MSAPDARDLLREDSRYFLHQAQSTPCLNAVRRLEGIYLEDAAGRRYMDFHGNNVHHIGYSHPRLIAALKTQLDELSFSPRRYTNRVAVDLARAMAELTGGALPKCLFAPSGSDAVEIALKLARGVTGRHRTVSFFGSFHGAGFGAAAVSGDAVFRDPRLGPLAPGALFVPPPYPYRSEYGSSDPDECARGCVSAIRTALGQAGDPAALIACPVRPSEYVPPAWFWKDVKEACREAGALLIFDEIPYGLGKTGRMFGFQHYGVEPDILVTGKALGGSVMPIACVSAREDLDLLGDLEIGHYTHEKNPLSAAAALATLGIIREEGLVDRAAGLGAAALQMAVELQGRHRLVGDVRGLGLVMGLELVSDPLTRAPALVETERVFQRALELGLSMKTTGSILALSPPLVITRQELERAFDVIDQCLAEVEARGSGRGDH
ncbi:MAG TPA: aspartate aminotransferase family protein [Spirochaetia bacterium]|nr:aspartate aminotransferase family protein [Spirochaetia bacterium]